jgi:DNA-nicking Smr family endonuclease
MTRRRELSEEEQVLWAGIARSIRPLRRTETDKSIGVKPALEKSAPAKPAQRQKTTVPLKPPAEAAKPLARAPQAARQAPAPLGRRLKQRVARGRESIDARLDLHGRTQDEAHAALLRFLRRAQGEGAKIVLVVTGKGARRREQTIESDRGVLRRQVPMWLALPEFRSFVVGFEVAHAAHGGEGALYVRLRRAK